MNIGFQTVVAVLVLGTSAMAQEVQIEVQMPMDSSGTVMEITPALRHKLGLFSDVPRFLSARLFQISDTSYILEVAYQLNRIVFF